MMTKILIPTSIAFIGLSLATVVLSQSRYEELEKKVSERSSEIQEIEKEIEKLSGELVKTSQESKTLTSALHTVDLSRKKIRANIELTEVRVEDSRSAIKTLAGEIVDTQEKIVRDREQVAGLLRLMDDAGSQSFIELFILSDDISAALMELGELESLHARMQEEILALRTASDHLAAKKSEHEEEKVRLLGYKEDLVDQKVVLDNERNEKDMLLSATQNKESEYKKLLADANARKAAMEKELEEFAAELKQEIDPGSIPAPGTKLFSPPLDKIRITQRFGRTVDSVRLYASGTHNGVDFRADRGSKIYSVADGIVTAIGNTDDVPGCYSYGKWILVKHPYGLSTMYAHLDIIKAAAGQEVQRGEIIGLSGKTGYATGPHLHLTVFATQGVQIRKYDHSKFCKAATIPIAPLNAYLDPEGYL